MQGFGRVKLSQQGKMVAARATVIAIAAFAIILAWNPNSSVFRVVSFAWAGFGATFGPTMLLALFWRRSNRRGAMAGLICGGVMIFLWKFGIARLGGVFAIYELLPAFIIALIADIVVSLATKEPSPVVTKKFDEVSRKQA
jgi:sodium/proline symporter